MEKFEELKALVASLEEHAIKFYEKGTKAAGARLRKGLQDVKTISQALRQDVSAKNKASKNS